VPADEADKVPAKEGRSSTVEADQRRGKREKGRLAKQPRSTNTEYGDGVTVFQMPTVPILQLR